jgi:hypothetical protein
MGFSEYNWRRHLLKFRLVVFGLLAAFQTPDFGLLSSSVVLANAKKPHTFLHEASKLILLDLVAVRFMILS